MTQAINYIYTLEPKTKPTADAALGFGQLFTDHMFTMDYVEGRGWINPTVCPYAPITLDPSCMVFHYGQAVFEGLKAYRRPDGGVNLFRPELNFERMNASNRRMGIPELDVALAMKALKALLDVDQDWVPNGEGTSLYIRPFVIATDAFLGVSVSRTYRFMIILSPSGAYYPQGMNPVNIYIEDEYVRAVRGGTGEAKCPGNYAASLVAQEKAHGQGYVQVLWLDGVEKRYVEEVGSMNVFFVIDGKVVTPQLTGSILPGITRRSVLELVRHWGMQTEERRVSVDELIEAAQAGRISEVFGSGTAAVVSPVGELMYAGQHFVFNNGQTGAVSQRLYDTLTGMQYGKLEDPFGWVKGLETL